MTQQPRPTIPALLTRASTEFGDHTYLVTPTDRLTYREADQRSGDLARWLLHRGVGKGTRVGLFFPNGVDWIVWWLAVSRVGALAVPLSTLYAPAEIAKVARLADVAVIVAPGRVLSLDVPERFEAAWPELTTQQDGRLAMADAPYLRRIVIVDGPVPSWATGCDGGKVPAEVLSAAEAEVSPADLAVVIHTSGSTADPKGVMHTHGTLVRQTSTWPAAIRAVTKSEGAVRILCAMPFFWVGGLLAATGALHEPVTVLALPRLEAEGALDLIERERAAGVIGWPAFTQRMREHPSFVGRDLSCAPMLRDGPLDIAMVDVPDGYPVHRTMSETAGGFAFTDMCIVDDDGAPVPDGEVGELLIRGIGVMAGYNKRERWETFDENGWYHTGDRVYRKPGDPRLFYVGRTTDMIKSAGANVSPLEVQAVIEEFPGVAQCLVLGIDDPTRGEQVCAVVVPTAAGIDVEALAAHTRAHLSAYKVPGRWVLTSSEQIPILSSGKFDRKTLSAMIADGALESVVG